MATAMGTFGVNGISNSVPPGTASSTLSDSKAVDHDATSEPDVVEMDRRHSKVQDLAREYTRQSTVSIDNPAAIFGSSDPNSPLNPRGDKFNARVWAKTVAKAANDQGQSFRQVGLCFQNVNVFGYGTPTDFQKDVGNIWLALPGMARRLISHSAGQTRIDILQQFDGLIRSGEMCVVLGPPGSGCSTFLKTISGETNGIYVNENSYFNYQGLSAKEMHTAHRGDAIYTAEVDIHFPLLTVGDTLTFAARARCKKDIPQGISRNQYVSPFQHNSRHVDISAPRYCEHLRDVVMAMYGISHTIDTKVGDEFTRGVSGGERKRVTIAEATLAEAPFQCWDK